MSLHCLNHLIFLQCPESLNFLAWLLKPSKIWHLLILHIFPPDTSSPATENALRCLDRRRPHLCPVCICYFSCQGIFSCPYLTSTHTFFFHLHLTHSHCLSFNGPISCYLLQQAFTEFPGGVSIKFHHIFS